MVIGIALLNALANGSITLFHLVIANVVIVGIVSVLEAAPFSGREESRLVNYDRLDLLSPDAATELLADLRQRTHLPVERFEIGDVDLLRDSARITVYYRCATSPGLRRSPLMRFQDTLEGIRLHFSSRHISLGMDSKRKEP